MGQLSRLHLDDIALVQIACGDDVYVIDDIRPFAQKLESLLADVETVKVFHNAVFDLGFLSIALGSPIINNVFDTMLAERVLTNGTGLECSLKAVADRYLQVHLDKGLQTSFGSYSFTDDQIEYAAKDAQVLPAIRDMQMAKLRENGLMKVMQLENDLAPIVAGMEVAGMGFDGDRWKILSDSLLRESQEVNNRIQSNLGLEHTMTDFFGNISGINLNSRDQVLSQLKKIGIDLPDYRDQTLKSYAAKHPECTVLQDIIDYRHATKALSFAYHDYVNPVTGRIHAKFTQLGSRAGRFSSSDPNLQQVPAQKRFRDCFVANDGKLLVTADYSQQEMRLMAQASGDENLINVCTASDIHAENARVMYKDDSIDKNDKRRMIAKNAGFAWLYGSGPETMAVTAGISVSDARDVLAKLSASYPMVDKWAKRQLKQLYEKGYIETLLGRRRWLVGAKGSDEIVKYARIAKNTPIQGSGADIIKYALVEIGTMLRGYAQIISTIHDEIIVEVDEDDAESVKDCIIQCMEYAGEKLIDRVPVVVEAGMAKEWSKGE